MGNGQGITQSERSTCLRIHQSSPARISDRDHVPGPQGCTERLLRLAPVLLGAAVFDSSAGNVPAPRGIVSRCFWAQSLSSLANKRNPAKSLRAVSARTCPMIAG